MSEFQWRNQMRKLDQSVEPARDLWPDIASRIAQSRPAAVERGWRRGFAAMAATLVVASAAALVGYRIDRNTALQPVAASTAANDAAPRTALDWAVPADPNLATVAQGLDKASADLQQALEARPDAVFLVSMLNRTNAQRMRLMRQSEISG